ncbi:hypothetical protein Mgra_00007026 [Meloidogyne graminicola]|uniref:Uncharacterized protein n=1 Tax=Meloidogyne graminicola TaxID=189291 RepID=A0A8S9ZJC9_9BILA|nr:hypothetical protein Mgra_00007026 [Meloidogyne graminicola]
MSVDTSDIAEIRQRMLTKDEAMEKLLTKDDAEGEFVTLAQFKEFKDDMKGIRTYKLELMKMSIILLLFFAFLMIFNTNSETRLEKFEKMYAKLPNPIPIYLNIFPCPNCEEWCANHPKYTCNYSCGPPYYDFYGVKDINIHRPFIGENVVKELKGEMENFVHDALVKRFLNVSKVVIKNTYVSKEVKQIKEFCANLTNKNFTCKFHNSKYPICSSDFKAYDSGMEGFCKLAKDCYAKIKNEPINLKECTDIIDSFYIVKLKIDRDNINSNYSWTIDNNDEEMLTKYFGM